MAYGTKYQFKFESVNGADSRIDVQLDGYTGTIRHRALGQPPVLKRQTNDRILGTSLEFWAECLEDGEFAEFYTSDPKAYRVILYRADVEVWRGFITPEIYSEPDTAAPYDVDIVATDGIGELKLYDYEPQGLVSLRDQLEYLLGFTGQSTDVRIISRLASAGAQAVSALRFFDDLQMSIDYKAGDTCYEALQHLLSTFCATLTYDRGSWWLVRETDMVVSGSGVQYFSEGDTSMQTLSGAVKSLGGMDSADLWPVGYTKTSIEPAKRSVTVKSPWHPGNPVLNPDMQSDASWAKAGGATYKSAEKCYDTGATGGVAQTLPNFDASHGFALTVRYGLNAIPADLSLFYVGALRVTLTEGVGGTKYYLRYSDGSYVWSSTSSEVIDPNRSLSVTYDRSDASEFAFSAPACYNADGIPVLGALNIAFISPCSNLYHCDLAVNVGVGYQDVLRLGNGARGEAGDVEIAGGRMRGGALLASDLLDGIFKPVVSARNFTDGSFTDAMPYLDLIARDYALGVALPRLRVRGQLDTPAGMTAVPVVVTKDDVPYCLGEYSWDLYTDELEVDLLSLPAAELTISQESIEPAQIDQF